MPSEPPPVPPPRLPRWLLLAGLLSGIGLAAGDLILRRDAMPDNVVARVNDKLIPRDAWLRAVAAVAAERRPPLPHPDQPPIPEPLIYQGLSRAHGPSP